MKTEHKLAEALKQLMSEKPLEDISVTLLTNKCGINRKSFYYHFHDIYDLLTLIFLNEKIPQLEQASNIKMMIVAIYQYYSKNSKFINATINSAGKDLFEQFLYNNTYKTILRFINENYLNKILFPNDKKAIARFYSFAYSYSIAYYLSTYKNKSLDGLLSCFSFENDENIGKSMLNMTEIRVRNNSK